MSPGTGGGAEGVRGVKDDTSASGDVREARTGVSDGLRGTGGGGGDLVGSRYVRTPSGAMTAGVATGFLRVPRRGGGGGGTLVGGGGKGASAGRVTTSATAALTAEDALVKYVESATGGWAGGALVGTAGGGLAGAGGGDGSLSTVGSSGTSDKERSSTDVEALVHEAVEMELGDGGVSDGGGGAGGGVSGGSDGGGGAGGGV